MILYFLCTRRNPFNVSDFFGSGSDRFGYLESELSDLDAVEPESLRFIIKKCVSKDPKLRPDISEIIQDLDNLEVKCDLISLFPQDGKIIDIETFIFEFMKYINYDYIKSKEK